MRNRRTNAMVIVDIRRVLRRSGLGVAVVLAACMAQEVKLVGPGSSPGGGGTGGGTGNTGPALTVAPSSGSLAINSTLQLTPTLRDPQGIVIPITGVVTWTSANPSVVTVDASGRARGVANGTAVVTASTAGAAGNSTLTVVGIPVATVVITPGTATLQLGTSAQFAAITRDAAGNSLPGRPVSWWSSDAAVMTVGTTGLVQAVGTGSATLNAVSEGRTGTASVTVQNIPVATVLVTPANDTVQIGQQVTLVATPRDAGGIPLTGRTVTWSSSAPSVARVSGNGLIDGLAAGTATITATSEGQTGTALITVIPVPVASVVVVPQSVTVLVGSTTTFAGTPRDANGSALSGRVVTWASANPSVATVNASGVVSGVAPGTVSISATCEGVVGSAFVTVTTAPATLVSVIIAPQTAALQSGQTQAFSLTGTLSDGSSVPVTGTYTAQSGTINGAGIYTAPDASGTFRVIGTAAGTSLRDTANVTVTRPPVATVQVTPTSGTIDVGRTLGLSATMRDASGNILTSRVVTWTTNSATVATVSSSGVVTGRGVGSATITATSEGQSATAAITVQITPVATVQVTPTAATIEAGLSTQLAATIRDAGGNVLIGRVVTWSSSAPGVASVDATGLVTAVTAGVVTITATCETRTGTATVTSTVTPVASVTVTPASATLAVGQAVQMTATPRSAAGTPLARPVTWSSNAPTIVSVSAAGLATAVAEGNATITATSGGVNGTSSLAVTAGQTLYPNQPVGAVPRLAWVMDLAALRATFPETDAQPWSYASGNPPARLDWGTTVSDPTGPINPTRIGRLEINPSNVSLPLYGNGIEKITSTQKFVPPGSAKKIYWSYWFKYQNGFVQYAFQLKQTEMFYNTGGTIVATTRETAPWHMEFYNWNGTTTQHAEGSIPINTDQWYHIEVVVDQQTWRHQLWVNGVLDIDRVMSVHGIGNPAEFGFVWVYGGGGSPGLGQLNKSIYAFWDAFYMSYVP